LICHINSIEEKGTREPDEKGRKGLWLKKNNYFKETQFDWGEIVIFAEWIETIAGIF
jgi:hypothetical protein